MPPIDDLAGASPEVLRDLRAALEDDSSLQSAVRWAFAKGYDLLDVIHQDEFTRDLVFRIAADRYLVYDAT